MKTRSKLLCLAAVPLLAAGMLALVSAPANAAGAAQVLYTTTVVTASATGSHYSVMTRSGLLKPGLTAPASTKNVSPLSTSESTYHCVEDSSFSVDVCGWLYYNWYDTANNGGYAELTKISEQGFRYDSQVVLSKINYTAAATGPCGTGCSNQPSNKHSGYVPQPTSGTKYSQTNTWWSGYQRVTAYDVYELQETLVWVRGTGSHNLSQTIKIPTDGV